MSHKDLEYFTQRERNERARAENALDQTARRAHLAMADRYAERLRAMLPAMSLPEPV